MYKSLNLTLKKKTYRPNTNNIYIINIVLTVTLLKHEEIGLFVIDWINQKHGNKLPKNEIENNKVENTQNIKNLFSYQIPKKIDEIGITNKEQQTPSTMIHPIANY
jgi:hypothetical protein